MTYYADPRSDLPAPWKEKRIIFYAAGLKIYGQIPYLLQRKLHAEFISSEGSFMGGRIFGPTLESNYTIVPYRRDDGSRHSQGAVQRLLDWLYADKGFEWTIAVPGEFQRRDLRLINWFNAPPQTFVPGGAKHHDLIRDWLLEAGPSMEEEE